MSYNVVCDACDIEFSARDRVAGQRVRCPECGDWITVGGRRGERPVRRRRDPQSAFGSGLLVALIGIGLLAALLAGGGIIAMVLMRADSTDAGADATGPIGDPQAAPAMPAMLPPLGPARRIRPGINMHEVFLRPGDTSSKIWIYLPVRSAGKLPCVLIGPAGSTGYVGMELAPDDQDEHFPYVQAGFAVVSFAISGHCPDIQNASDHEMRRAYTEFKNADAGVVNARQALDYALARVPAIDPQRIAVAGHSSAAMLAILVAAREPRIQACAAYAPAADFEKRLAPNMRSLSAYLPGFREFVARTSPLRNAGEVRCPLFLFHAEDDDNCPIADSARLAQEVRKVNSQVTFVRAANGGHFESMMRQGIPQGIRWLQGLPPRKP